MFHPLQSASLDADHIVDRYSFAQLKSRGLGKVEERTCFKRGGLASRLRLSLGNWQKL